MTGANTYTGGTTIEEGQLLVDNTTGSGLGSGSVQVNAGRLGGNGTIAGAVTVGTGTGAGATLAPGERCDELGVITILGTLTFNSDARYNCGLKNRQHVDKIIANGVTINGGKFVFDANSSSALRRGTVLTVIDNTAATPIVGTFDNLADGSIFAIGNTYQVSYEGNDGNDLTLTVVLAAFAVTTTDPACNNIINTLPNDFVVNLSEAAGPGTVQAGDFTVNGLPADSFVLSNGNATITFHFNSSPVVTQGVQTMHIPAGAFNRASDNQGVFDFTCTFRYDALQLQVVSTNPPVGGTFSPPAPNNYQYDVNFNEAVDAASVQTSDLTVSGTGVPSVTGVSVISGNMTARFTLHMNFGGSLSASIAAGAIADQFGNPGAAFSGSYTVAGCPPQDHYDIGQIGGGIEPGTTDIGNHCEGCVTTIALPFPYAWTDQTYSSITLSSSGNAQFTTLDAASRNLCLPWTAHNYTILPFWDHLYTGAGGFGIFTSVTGTAPNRIFNIEWRADYVIGTGTANFELRLYEDQNRFDVIYGSVTRGNTSATAGVQKNDSTFDQYFCNGSGGVATGGQSYTQPCTP